MEDVEVLLYARMVWHFSARTQLLAFQRAGKAMLQVVTAVG